MEDVLRVQPGIGNRWSSYGSESWLVDSSLLLILLSGIGVGAIPIGIQIPWKG